MKKHIPNTITCCNLLCGAAATYMATQHEFVWAFLLILLASIFDFLDGFTARLLKVSTPIGKELDSLADNITFGLAPTMMLFCFLKTYTPLGWWSLIVFVMAALSAVRLAKFNLDERQTSSFIGLATPPNAIFWASLTSFLAYGNSIISFEINDNVINCTLPQYSYRLGIALVVACLISSYLLVSEIPFFSLKFHNLRWKENKPRFIYIIGNCIFSVALAVLALVFHWQYLLAIGVVVIIWYFCVNLCTKH